MNRILKAYLKRLTNLSTNNKSLLLTRLTAEQFFDLHHLDFLLGKSSVEIVRQLVQRKAQIPLCDVTDPRFEKVNEASKKLRKIARTEQFIKEERGSRDLFVGYPFVKGKLSDGTPIHAPLLFFPVTLKTDRGQWCLFEREESDIVLNQSFALAYSHFNHTIVPDEILEKSFDELSKDFLEFRTQLYEWLKQTPFKINFNQQLFEDNLISFSLEKRAALTENERNGELKLYPEAVLGIFPQAGSYLVPDYQLLLDQSGEENVALPFFGEGREDEMSSGIPASPVREEELLTPFSIDESQEQIILEIKSGKSVVVQGPPGSGKSQLICNLMADFASRGKKVLVVCQKRAALDVVYQRLQTIGLTDFVGLIHDFKNDRPALYQQLAAQIEKVEAYRQQNYSLDAVFLERQFTRESRSIDKIVAELESFRAALFSEQECGVSIKELYLTSDPTRPTINLSGQYKYFKIDGLDEFNRRLKAFVDYGEYLGNDHPWTDRKSFATFGIGELRQMEMLLTEWPDVLYRQKAFFENNAQVVFSSKYIENRPETLERLQDIASLIQDEITFKLFQKYSVSNHHAAERLAFVRQVTESLEGFLAEDGIELSLPSIEVSTYCQYVRKAIESKKSPVTSVWWNVFSKEKKSVGKLAGENGLSVSLHDLQKLEIKLRNRKELDTWLSNELLGFEQSFLLHNIFTEPAQQYAAFFRNAEAASDATMRRQFEPWKEIMTALISGSADQKKFSAQTGEWIKWLNTWQKLETAVLTFLTSSQWKHLVDSPEHSAQLVDSLRRDFDSLADMDRLWEEMSRYEQEVTIIVLSEGNKNGLKGEDLVDFFENSLKLAWIEHIENKHPQLRSVASLKMQQSEGQIQESIGNKQRLSAEITAMKLRESTYKDIEKNRLGNRVTYRELGHQVTKKRKIWPIRKLLDNYAEEVFSLIPCWMASPEAVSAIFPMQSALFDLVIFDEASQCYAELGLPAAFRGAQVVVAGDSKQLAPNDLYRVRYEEKEEDDYHVAMEVESLLDLAGQGLNQYQLTGHYRSLSLDLIDFSNQHFYKGSLKLLPDFGKVNDGEPGIHYVKTEGIWAGNTNHAEVQKVAELVKELGKSSKSVGVVTFNFFQQQAILDYLEAGNISAKALFVKNIENVQGDERDIIIFSMGYAPDENGKISMNFGSLNMAGGENRLNVAVTRAREKIYFVTSLWPAQLQTGQAANAGPRLLKAYLEYAWTVSQGNYQPRPNSAAQFRSDWLLKEKLVRENAYFVKELPFADVTIKEKGAYKALILTDDDLYFHSKSAKEPHAYLPLLLKVKNWRFQRMYSRQYWSGTMETQQL